MTDKKRRGLDLALCLGAGLFYLLNVHVLRGSVGGAIGWFLACYANDVFAGLAICAWLMNSLINFLEHHIKNS